MYFLQGKQWLILFWCYNPIMKNLRGNHTTLTPLSRQIVLKLKKAYPRLEISPGFIESGIKAKTRSVYLTLEKNNVILATIISTSSKQHLRIYNSNILEIKGVLSSFNLTIRDKTL